MIGRLWVQAQVGICCFSAKHAALRNKRNDLLAWNQEYVSEWSDMSIAKKLLIWP